MSRLDSPGHVALLFAGAALVSLLLVALLTAEAKTRKALRVDPVIENTNLFSSLGRRVTNLFTRQNEIKKNEEEKISPQSLNDVIDSEVMSVRRTGRDLKSLVVTRQENASDYTWWSRSVSSSTPPHQTHHRHRHNGDRRLHHQHLQHKTQNTEHNSSTENNLNSSTMINNNNNNNNINSETCYGPNEVLLIIAITCAVNFAFIFGVMTIVHLCNVRNNHHSNESLTSIVSLGHSESLTLGDGGCPKLRRGSCGHDGSLPGSMTLLLLPELDDTRPWQNAARRLSQYQPLLAHSMEDLHILE